jgi:hypothetical protein
MPRSRRWSLPRVRRWRGSIRVGCSLCLRFLPGSQSTSPIFDLRSPKLMRDSTVHCTAKSLGFPLAFPLSSHYTFGGAYDAPPVPFTMIPLFTTCPLSLLRYASRSHGVNTSSSARHLHTFTILHVAVPHFDSSLMPVSLLSSSALLHRMSTFRLVIS